MKKLALLLLAVAPSAFASAHSGMGWFGTQVVSSLIHGAIYGVIYKLFRSMGLVPSLLVGAAILGGAYYFWRQKQKTDYRS